MDGLDTFEDYEESKPLAKRGLKPQKSADKKPANGGKIASKKQPERSSTSAQPKKGAQKAKDIVASSAAVSSAQSKSQEKKPAKVKKVEEAYEGSSDDSEDDYVN